MEKGKEKRKIINSYVLICEYKLWERERKNHHNTMTKYTKFRIHIYTLTHTKYRLMHIFIKEKKKENCPHTLFFVVFKFNWTKALLHPWPNLQSIPLPVVLRFLFPSSIRGLRFLVSMCYIFSNSLFWEYGWHLAMFARARVLRHRKQRHLRRTRYGHDHRPWHMRTLMRMWSTGRLLRAWVIGEELVWVRTMSVCL